MTANKKINKSTLSMFLRTRCDKELFLSLHDKKSMGAASLPEPVKRPGIGILSVEGKDFEKQRNEQLTRLFSTQISFTKDTFRPLDLASALRKVGTTPHIVLQGQFSIGAIKQQTLRCIGLSEEDIALTPDIADFVPDILVVREQRAGDLAVEVDGARKAVNGDGRLALEIFDIKHTSEANPSYCAEIAMYALMMANWLASNPELHRQFFVASSAYLWTRFKQGDSALDRLESVGGATESSLLSALVADSEDANLRFYLASVRRFFEDVARVIRIGDSGPGAWSNLEWHVSGRCSNCDWLGDRRHLSKDAKAVVDAHPDHYCMSIAKASGHLCLVPGITRGARKILQQNQVASAAELAASANHPALQKHTALKREARSLPARSAAILSGTLSNDATSAIASLVPSAHLTIYASVNFDPSAGLLTGLALCGTATAFQTGQAPTRFAPVPFVVDQKSLDAEWVALRGFLSQIASWIDVAEGMVPNPNGQIHFWEQRQFQELCNAMGRHLPRVLGLAERVEKALAWVFPAEEFVARPEALEASTVVTVEDLVRRMVFAPTPHVITLFDTVEHYSAGQFNPAVKDSYYREFLGNGIPRERIYEIWSGAPQIKRGTTMLPRNTAISQFSQALERQSKSLESICERLRTDYKGRFKAKATRIPTSIPQGARGVAFDGKLWVWWDSLDFNTAQLEAHMRLSLEGERLEATYEAIILTNGRALPTGEYEFDVSSGSTEAKFKEDSLLTLGKLGRPGMPLERVNSLISPGAAPYAGTPSALFEPLWSALKAELVLFDRVNARAIVAFSNSREPALVRYLFANSSVDLLTDVFLLEGKKPNAFDWSLRSTQILKGIRNPSIAAPDQGAAAAMGIAIPAKRGSDPITPPARVLWDASSLERQSIIPNETAKAIALYAASQNFLNDSQTQAVEHAAERALSVIWGPPGTGKTSTLAALLHALVHHARTSGQPLKLLVTGPTYKAVDEVMHRAALFLAKDPATRVSMYSVYSSGRTMGASPAGLPAHVSYLRAAISNSDVTYQRCMDELRDNASVVIVGCQIRQARRFPEAIGSSAVHPVFDVVVVDESSQVPVSQSLSALCGLKSSARLVVAGDHLQMPPITSLDAPRDAAYMVGSIQTYLLERRFASSVNRCVLEKNYRSNEHIVEFARVVGYPPTLESVFPETALHLVAPLPERSAYPASLPWCPAFPDLLTPQGKVLALIHNDEVSSQGNHFEARFVAGFVWMLRQSVSANLDGRGAVSHAPPSATQFWEECIGVVTPHRAQRALVIRELERIFPGERSQIESAVDTVERFQGGQRHTIVVTFGVADTDVIGGEESFLMQLERTNVAISRAMAKCLVVMPNTLAAHIPEDRKALVTAFALKHYVEEFCDGRIDTTLVEGVESRWAQVRYHQNLPDR